MSNLQDRIVAAEEELVSLKDSLVEATKSLEAAPEEDALLVEVEELTDKVEKSSHSLEALKKAESALAARAKPVDAPAVVQHKHLGNAQKGDGDLLFKHATAKLVAHAKGERDVSAVAERLYPENKAVKEVTDFITKTNINPATTGVTGWAA